MSPCRKCGKPIIFVKKEFGGVLKWVPVNPDLSEHWDACKGIVRTPEWCARRIAQEHAEYPTRLLGRHGHVYCGDVPPWDESLGDFRTFTKAEIAEKAICRRVASR